MVVTDRDPNLKSEDLERGWERSAGRGNNIICKQKTNITRNIQRYIQLSMSEMLTNSDLEWRLSNCEPACIHFLMIVIGDFRCVIGDLCDL